MSDVGSSPWMPWVRRPGYHWPQFIEWAVMGYRASVVFRPAGPSEREAFDEWELTATHRGRTVRMRGDEATIVAVAPKIAFLLELVDEHGDPEVPLTALPSHLL